MRMRWKRGTPARCGWSAYAARRERAAASSQKTKQTTVNYTQNNYSPKPISAIDAYQAGLDVSQRLARELGR
jgi:hypothetical protein